MLPDCMCGMPQQLVYYYIIHSGGMLLLLLIHHDLCMACLYLVVGLGLGHVGDAPGGDGEQALELTQHGVGVTAGQRHAGGLQRRLTTTPQRFRTPYDARARVGNSCC